MNFKFWFNFRATMPSSVFWFFFLTCFLIPSLEAQDEPVEEENCPDVSDICLTPECVKAAGNILRNLDESVNPCDDFYKFACGGWMEKHFIDDENVAGEVTVSSVLQDIVNVKFRVSMEKEIEESEPEFMKKIKNMYTSCMKPDKDKAKDTGLGALEDLLKNMGGGSSDKDKAKNIGAGDLEVLLKNMGGGSSGSSDKGKSEDTETLQGFLKTLGGWPVLEGENWDSSQFNWIDTLIQIRNLGGQHDFFLDLAVREDVSNNRYILQLKVPEYPLHLPQNAAYLAMMKHVAKKLGANEETLMDELLKVLNFETTLTTLSKASDETVKETYSKLFEDSVTVQDLAETLPEIDWVKYFNGILNEPVSDNEPLKMDHPGYIIGLGKLIADTESRVIADYIMWRTALSLLPFMSSDWRFLFKFFQNKEREAPRWKMCMDHIGKIAVSTYYVRKLFKEEIKDAALDVVFKLQKEIETDLDSNEWLEEGAKSKAKDKVNALRVFGGYAKELLDDTVMAEYFENLNVDGESTFNDTLAVWKWEKDKEYNQFHKPCCDQLEMMHYGKKRKPDKVVNDGCYVEGELPAAILQNPFFNKDQPKYLNFGGIGYFIGHDIFHIFDSAGRDFDEHGEKSDWWDATTDEKFQEKARCIMEQYNEFTLDDGIPFDGNSGQNEHISDNSGLKEAYRTYLSWLTENGEEKKLPGLKYTPKQIFWINFANVRCSKYSQSELDMDNMLGQNVPAQFRVNGAVSNMPEFMEDFQCEAGAAMNRENKCEIW